jgi:hypothetical protein
VIWPGRRRPRPTSPRRKAGPARVERVGLGDLRPDPLALLGQAAYLQLAWFETATAIAGRAADLADRETLTRIAAVILQKHHDLVDLITERGGVAAEAMRPYTAEVERYRRRLGDIGWHESVLTLHLATGLLDDFFARLASTLPDQGARIAEILDREFGHEALVALLRAAVAGDRRLTSRLALWGRRLVGDTLLLARAAVATTRTADGRPTTTDDVRVEPVLTDLIAAHTRRMDELGLTA